MPGHTGGEMRTSGLYIYIVPPYITGSKTAPRLFSLVITIVVVVVLLPLLRLVVVLPLLRRPPRIDRRFFSFIETVYRSMPTSVRSHPLSISISSGRNIIPRIYIPTCVMYTCVTRTRVLFLFYLAEYDIYFLRLILMIYRNATGAR